MPAAHVPITPPQEQPVAPAGQPQPVEPARRHHGKRRRSVRVALWTLLAVVLAALGAGGWALNRYVIDHVEISDVKTYESQVNAGTTDVPIATFPVAG